MNNLEISYSLNAEPGQNGIITHEEKGVDS